MGAPCVLEAIGTFFVALSILITADPFRDARAVVKHVARRCVRGGQNLFFSERRSSGHRASSEGRRRETPFDAFAEDGEPQGRVLDPRGPTLVHVVKCMVVIRVTGSL